MKPRGSHIVFGSALAAMLAACAWAQTGTATFPFGFDRGLNLRDNPVVLGASGEYTRFAVGNTYNFDFRPDGTAWQIGGATTDTVFAGTGAVNMLAYDPTPYLAGVGLTFAVVDTHVYQRFNQAVPNSGTTEGTWKQVAAPAYRMKNLRLKPLGDYSATYYNGALRIGGDAAYAFEPYGTIVGTAYQLRPTLLPPVLNDAPTATASSGGTLDSNTTYYYVYTFTGYRTSAGGTVEESYASASSSVATTGANRTITVGDIKRFPEEYFVASVDTAKFVLARNIYRSTNGADYYYLATLYDYRASTYVDNGAIAADITLAAPDPLKLHAGYKYAAPYADFLWTSGHSRRPATWRTTASLGNASTDTLLSIDGFTAARNPYVSCVVPANWTTANYGTYRTVVTSSGSTFLSSDIRIGDYFSSRDAAKQILAITSDTTFVVEYLNYSATDKKCPGSIGRNICYLEDEVIGLVYRTATQWRISRGLLGTTRATHASGTLGYHYLGRLGDSYIYVSERFNPQRYIPVQADGEVFGNYANPIDVSPGQYGAITGLLSSEYLAIYKERAVYGMYGSGISSFTMQRLFNGIGNVSPRALARYRQSNLFLDRTGVYAHGQADATRISDVLGTAISDSAASGYYDDAAGVIHRDRYYLSVVKNASTKATKTWVYDFVRDTWSCIAAWEPRTWGLWPEASDGEYKLYFGDWDGGIYKVLESSQSGTGQSIAAELWTPAFNFGDDDGVWEEMHLTIDTNDSVLVSFRIGAFDSTFTVGPSRDGVAGRYPITRADSSMTAGVPKTFIIPIRATGHTCQARIYKSGTGRCTIYPSAIIGRRKRI